MYTFAEAESVARVTMGFFRPPPNMTVAEWADAERFLSAESSASPGRFKTEIIEYFREPMEMVGKPGVRRITLMTSAQVGKSTVIENVIGYFMAHDPCPILHVSPTLESMKMFSKERLAPMIRDTPSLRGIVKDPRSRDSGNTLNSKALALDTPIPTPDGWTTMGDLKPGDSVFAVDGSVCSVITTSPVFEDHDCYRVTFSDGDSVVADAGHLWEVLEWKVDKSQGKPTQKRCRSVKRTSELFTNFRKGDRFRYSLPKTEPIATPMTDLPVDPYFLGFWIGDGFSHTSLICVNPNDAPEVTSKIPYATSERASRDAVKVFRVGDVVRPIRDSVTGRMRTVSHGLTHELRQMGVISGKGSGRSKKHIPSFYLRSSAEQRKELLRGLMDSDGHVSKGTCYFTTVLPHLAETFSELLASLGLRSSFSKQITSLNGERYKDAYLFSFASPDFAVFHLKRKRDAQFNGKSKRPHGGRRIINVEPVDSVPVRCISIDHPRKLFLAGRSMFPTHNTFPGGHIAMVGSNAPAGLASRPVRVMVADEVDRFELSAGSEGDPLSLAVKRTTTFWNRVIVFVSTPGNKGESRIEPEFLRGDQRYYHVPCVHCGEHQTLKWAQVRWTDGNPDTTFYECEHNGCVWDDQDRRVAIRRGHWEVTQPFNGNVSYHLSQLYSPFAPLSDGVRDFLDAKDNPELLKTWTNTFLGETWEERGARLEWSELLDQREDYQVREPIPEGVTLITVAVDVQDDRFEMEWVGWGDDNQSWSLGYRKIVGDPSAPDVWNELESALSEGFMHPLFGEMVWRAGAIDSGGHYTQAVYKFAERVPRLVAIKGVEGRGKPIFGSRMKNTINNATVFPVGVDTAKELVVARLKVRDPDKAGYCRWPADYDETYFLGLTAEELRTTYIRGFRVLRWQKIRVRNEPFDLRVYNTAALELLQVDLNAQRRAALRDISRRDNDTVKPKKKTVRRKNWANSWKE